MNKTTLWASALVLPLTLSTASLAQSAPPAASPPGAMTTPVAPAKAAPPADAMAPSAGPASTAALSAGDKAFVEKAAVGGMAEVQAGKLALTKSQDQRIKDFAQHMVDDHGPNNDELMKLAAAKGVTPPTELDSVHQKEISKLESLDGKKFDRAYVAGQMKGHKAMLKAMQAEQTKGRDADLKAFADKTVPVVQQHITMIPKAGA